MKELHNIEKFYEFLEEHKGDWLFGKPTEKFCTVGFDGERCKMSIEINEAEMGQLIRACVKAFGLKAVVSAASEADDE